MSTADNSYLVRTTRLKATTLATFHRLNPTANEFFGSQGDQQEYLIRTLGQRAEVIQPPNAPNYITGGCCGGQQPCDTIIISNFQATSPIPDFIDPNYVYTFTWNINVTGLTYSFSIISGTIESPVFALTGPTSATLTFPATSFNNFTVQITAGNACSTRSVSTEVNPCFLAGSLIAMADGTTKAIEDVQVGDIVIGAFGEHNEVLALHRPKVGTAKMSHINNEHHSTSHHPHISPDRKFYCQHPATVENTTYGKEHDVITKDGSVEKRLLHGLKKGRVQELKLGQMLKTIEGEKVVETLETYSLDPETQLYNLVVGGSHTYHVDGYAVTGWPREDDFDYDNWVALIH